MKNRSHPKPLARPALLRLFRTPALSGCLMPALVTGAAHGQVTIPSAQQQRPVEKPLKLNLSFDATYDDNILRVNERTSPVTDDMILRPRAVIAYHKPLGKTDLLLDTDVAYSHYAANSDRSRLNAMGKAAVVLRSGLCELTPMARLRVEDADYGDINGPVGNRQTFTTFSGKFSCPREFGFYPVAEIARDETDNDNAFAFADQRSMTYSAGIGYARPTLGRASLYYSRLESKRPTLGITTNVDRAGVTFRRAVVSHLSLTVDLHYLNVRSRGAQIASYDGLGWDGVLTLNPVGRVALEAGTTRRIINDSLVPSGYAVASEYRLRARWQVQDRFQIRAAGEWGNRSFKQDPAVIGSPIGADRYFLVSGGVQRILMRGLDLLGNVQYIRRTTDSDVNSFRALLATAGISFSL